MRALPMIYMRTLPCIWQMKGKEHADTLAAALNLASHYHESNQSVRAHELADKTLAIAGTSRCT